MEKPIIVNQYGLRCLIDPDDPKRKPTEVITYRLSPEEIEARYGKPQNPSNIRKPIYKRFESNEVKKIRSEENCMKTKITTEQLVKECKKLGFTMKAYADIAKKYGFASAQTVASHVSKRNIRKLVEDDTHIETKKPPAEIKPVVVSQAANDDVVTSDELEILSKIKDLLNENKQLKSATEQLRCVAEKNIAIKESLVQLKANIEEIVKLIS